MFEVDNSFEISPSDNLGGTYISNSGLELIMNAEKNRMTSFNYSGNRKKRPERIVTFYRHYNGTLIDNKYILYTHLNSNVLEKYIKEKTIAIRVFSVDEFAQGDYRENIKILNLISEFGNIDAQEMYNLELNDREFVYVVSNGILKVLKRKNLITDGNDQNLIVQLIMDYIILTNCKDIKIINKTITTELELVKNIDDFFEKLHSKIQQRVKLVDTTSSVTRYDGSLDGDKIITNGSGTPTFINDNVPGNLEIFEKYVYSVDEFYKLIKQVGEQKYNYYVIDILKEEGTTIANKYLENNNILLKYFKVINKVSDLDGKLVEYPYSSGELHLIRLVSRMYYFVGIRNEYTNGNNDRTLLFLLDEPDTSLHPEWQRVFWKDMIDMLSEFNQNIQILFTSHSPLLISDIPRSNLNIFNESEDSINLETFSANIYDLYKISFFLDKPMGEFAYFKINDYYEKILRTIEKQERLDPDEIEEYEKLINIVGDKIIKKDMEDKMNMYKKKFENNTNQYLIMQLEREIEEKKLKLEKLRTGDKND